MAGHRALDRLEDGRFLLGFERVLDGVEALIRSRSEAAAGLTAGVSRLTNWTRGRNPPFSGTAARFGQVDWARQEAGGGGS